VVGLCDGGGFFCGVVGGVCVCVCFFCKSWLAMCQQGTGHFRKLKL